MLWVKLNWLFYVAIKMIIIVSVRLFFTYVFYSICLIKYACTLSIATTLGNSKSSTIVHLILTIILDALISAKNNVVCMVPLIVIPIDALDISFEVTSLSVVIFPLLLKVLETFLLKLEILLDGGELIIFGEVLGLVSLDVLE